MGDWAFRSFLFAAAMNMLRRHYRKQAKRNRELDDFAEVMMRRLVFAEPTMIGAPAEE